MHEMAISEELVKVVDEALRGAGEGLRVEKVIIKLGKFAAVVPHCMEFYYDMFTKGTPMHGAELVFEHVPVRVRCNGCDEEFEPEEPRFPCPSCGSADIEIISGRELFVESIEVADPNAGDKSD